VVVYIGTKDNDIWILGIKI